MRTDFKPIILTGLHKCFKLNYTKENIAKYLEDMERV
jgi:hypothetical protein